MERRKVRLTHLARGKGVRAGNIYATITDMDGGLLISATVDYVLDACTERGWEIQFHSTTASTGE